MDSDDLDEPADRIPLEDRRWVPIVPQDGNDGGPFAIKRLIYGHNGQQYPRLALSVHWKFRAYGFSLTSAQIDSPDDRWCEDWGIPAELAGEAAALLASVAASRSNHGP